MHLEKQLKSINSKIQRMNRYYNSYTELFARSIELFVLERAKFSKRAPMLDLIYSEYLTNDNTNLLRELITIINN